MSVKSLLEKVEPLQALSFVQLPSCLLDDIVGLNTYVQIDHELINARLTYKEFYKNVDSHEKYGQILGFVYLDNEPVFMYSRGGRWLDTYCTYRISHEIFEKYSQFILSCVKNDTSEFDRIILTDEMITDFDWFGDCQLLNEDIKFPYVERSGIVL